MIFLLNEYVRNERGLLKTNLKFSNVKMCVFNSKNIVVIIFDIRSLEEFLILFIF